MITKAKNKQLTDMSNKVSIYDPFRGAYCEVDKEKAEKFIASAEEAKEKLAENSENEQTD
jgi:hypothetical protein